MKVNCYNGNTQTEYEKDIPVEKVLAEIDSLFPAGMATEQALQVMDALTEHINRKRTLALIWAIRCLGNDVRFAVRDH